MSARLRRSFALSPVAAPTIAPATAPMAAPLPAFAVSFSPVYGSSVLQAVASMADRPTATREREVRGMGFSSSKGRCASFKEGGVGFHACNRRGASPPAEWEKNLAIQKDGI